jgi:F-type H+-transporting ATPase subunit b
MPQLDFANYPFISQLFWLSLSFFVLYIYSAKTILPRISKTIEMRESTIKSALKDAEKTKKQLEINENNNHRILTKARLQASELINEAQENIEKKFNLKRRKTDSIIAEKLNASSIQIAKLKDNSKKEIDILTQDIYENLLKNYL